MKIGSEKAMSAKRKGIKSKYDQLGAWNWEVILMLHKNNPMTPANHARKKAIENKNVSCSFLKEPCVKSGKSFVVASILFSIALSWAK